MPFTILIVEDHDPVREALREWLKIVFLNCRVIEASDGEQAVLLAKASAPCLVVMDMDLPRMSGIEATQRIKTSVPTAQVVVLTLYEDEAHRADSMAAGASAYVPKRTMHSALLPTLVDLLSNAGELGRVRI